MDQPIPSTVDLAFNGRSWNLDLVPEFERIKCTKCKQWGHMESMCVESNKAIPVEKQKGQESSENPEVGQAIDDTTLIQKGDGEPQIQAREERVEEEQEKSQQMSQAEREREINKEGDGLEDKDKEIDSEDKEEDQRKKEGSPEIPLGEEGPGDGQEEEESDSEAVEVATTRRKRRGPDLGGDEKQRGRPSERSKRDKDTAEQVEMGLQKTLDGIKGKGKTKR